MRLDFLKKAKKSEIMGLTVVICGLIIGGYHFLFLSPVVSRLSFLFRETSRIQNRINKAEISIDSAPRIKKEIKELKAKEVFYSNKLPREKEFPAILEDLSGMARSSGVKITKILPMKDSRVSSEEDTGSGIYSQKAILINAQCGYHQLGAFIAELEGAERFMEVSDIRVEAGRINPKRHNVQLIVKTFILKGGSK